MPIARFINLTEMVDLFNESNQKNKIGRDTARKWRDQWLSEWNEAHPDKPLPGKDKKVIPYVWLEERFGEDVYRGLTLDDLTLAKLDVLRLDEGMNRSEFISKIIDEYIKAKEKTQPV